MICDNTCKDKVNKCDTTMTRKITPRSPRNNKSHSTALAL